MSENNNENLNAALKASLNEANARKKEQNEFNAASNAASKASQNTAAAEEKLRASREQTAKNIENMRLKEGIAQSLITKKTHNVRPIKNILAERRKRVDQSITEAETHRNKSTTANVASPLPKGWTEHITEDGKTYYYNKSLNKTQWERPANVASANLANPLPEGWNSKVDPASGKTYYYNESIKVTQWERPANVASANSASANLASANLASANSASANVATTASTGEPIYYSSYGKRIYPMIPIQVIDGKMYATLPNNSSAVSGPTRIEEVFLEPPKRFIEGGSRKKRQTRNRRANRKRSSRHKSRR
jgi:YHS domain-containing protein